MARQDDLTGMFTAELDVPAQPKTFRQGVIVTFDQTNLSNTVMVGRTLFTNLRVLGVAEAASYRPGAVVGIMVVGSSWAIIGRLVEPATPAAVDAITQLGQRTYITEVLTSESTVSPTYTDLTTVGPQLAGIRIPASGKALVTVNATVAPIFSTDAGSMDFEVTNDADGSVVRMPNIQSSLFMSVQTLGAGRQVGVSGLTPGGSYTFTAKYLVQGTQAAFARRMMTLVTP